MQRLDGVRTDKTERASSTTGTAPLYKIVPSDIFLAKMLPCSFLFFCRSDEQFTIKSTSENKKITWTELHADIVRTIFHAYLKNRSTHPVASRRLFMGIDKTMSNQGE